MIVEELSSGYYITELYVEYGDVRPRINDHHYRGLQEKVLKTGSGESQIIFQIDGIWFEVEPSRNIPIDTLSIPKEILNDIRVRNPPSRRGIRIPKPWLYDFLKGPNIKQSEAL